MNLTASERFARYIKHEPVDRAPVIEWAPWWHLTVNRWLEDGLPPEYASYEALQGYFGLDKCLQTSVIPRTGATPTPAGNGLGILENEEDYERIRPTLFAPPETLLPDAHFDWLNATRERGDTIHFFTVEGSFWYPRTLLALRTTSTASTTTPSSTSACATTTPTGSWRCSASFSPASALTS